VNIGIEVAIRMSRRIEKKYSLQAGTGQEKVSWESRVDK